MTVRAAFAALLLVTLVLATANVVVLMKFRRRIEGSPLFSVFFDKGWGRARRHYHLKVEYLVPPANPPFEVQKSTELRRLYSVLRLTAIAAIVAGCSAAIVGIASVVRW